MSPEERTDCPVCGGRGWHTANGNDPMDCGRCATPSAPPPNRDELGREALGRVAYEAWAKHLVFPAPGQWPGMSERARAEWTVIAEAVARAVVAQLQYCQTCGKTLDGYTPPEASVSDTELVDSVIGLIGAHTCGTPDRGELLDVLQHHLKRLHGFEERDPS